MECNRSATIDKNFDFDLIDYEVDDLGEIKMNEGIAFFGEVNGRGEGLMICECGDVVYNYKRSGSVEKNQR